MRCVAERRGRQRFDHYLPRKGRGFQDRPYYSAYMIHLPREGWVWYFSSPSGDSFPRVRARDGRPYPY